MRKNAVFTALRLIKFKQMWLALNFNSNFIRAPQI